MTDSNSLRQTFQEFGITVILKELALWVEENQTNDKSKSLEQLKNDLLSTRFRYKERNNVL